MALVTEEREVRIRCADYEREMQIRAHFGWKLKNKYTLNVFGAKVPDGTFDRATMMEKCSYEVHLFREVDDSVVQKLNKLEDEYYSAQHYETHLGKNIVGSVFLSAAFIVAMFFSIQFWGYLVGTLLLIACIILAGLIVTVLVTGIISTVKRNNTNERIDTRKNEILKEAKSLIK